MKVLYMCLSCPNVMDYGRERADQHTFRTAHRMMIQTPEAMLEGDYMRTKEQVVNAVERRLAAHIIDSTTPHDVNTCRCESCFQEFQRRWLQQ